MLRTDQNSCGPLSLHVVCEAIRIRAAPLHGDVWDIRRSQIIRWDVVPVVLPRYETFRLISIDDISWKLAGETDSSLGVLFSVVQRDERQT